MEPKISLTDFVDFSIRNGTTRLTKIKQIKGRQDYHPSKDYWKSLRDGLAEFHEKEQGKNVLDKIVDHAPLHKRSNYKNVIDSYKTFLGRKKIEWFTPPKDIWIFNNLSIRVNPELGLIIDGVPYLIKLYFKEDPSKAITKLDKRKLESIFYLMNDTLKDNVGDNTIYAVLNAKTGKLISKNKSVDGVKQILESDALAFKHLWDTI